RPPPPPPPRGPPPPAPPPPPPRPPRGGAPAPRPRGPGRVSMDMLAVDLTDLPEATVGAPVELWGTQLPVDEVAAHAGTIGYELLTKVTARVPRKYSA
ncbi:alanine racemase C-terminal domain-containing protein, partial [Pseudomonas citronellolis]|uniref:alanine racemase C-terminal domain-containing protein n=1 Tax=Pseudomonas citronellolis TaxID=53408 RepID=UPI0039F0603F